MKRSMYRTQGPGIESVLAMAAMEPRFAEALLTQRSQALTASGIPMSPVERSTLLHANAETLQRTREPVCYTRPSTRNERLLTHES